MLESWQLCSRREAVCCLLFKLGLSRIGAVGSKFPVLGPRLFLLFSVSS